MYNPGDFGGAAAGGIAGGGLLAVSGFHWWLPALIALMFCAAVLFGCRAARTRVRSY